MKIAQEIINDVSIELDKKFGKTCKIEQWNSEQWAEMRRKVRPVSSITY